MAKDAQKYRIFWNTGYGVNSEVIEAADLHWAEEAAYEHAREEFENSADYGAEIYDGSDED